MKETIRQETNPGPTFLEFDNKMKLGAQLI